MKSGRQLASCDLVDNDICWYVYIIRNFYQAIAAYKRVCYVCALLKWVHLIL